MTNNTQKPATWYWIVSSLALLWNMAGVYAFVQSIMLQNFGSDIERDLWSSTPTWAVISFGVAVFGGALGCIMLLLRNGWAGSFFMVSLAGIIVQNINSFFFSNSWEVFGPGGAIMPVMVIAFAIYLITLAKKAKANGWTS